MTFKPDVPITPIKVEGGWLNDRLNVWSLARVEKFVQIMGYSWFDNKRILEVGAGHGMIGNVLRDQGATVISTDGRASNLEQIGRHHPDFAEYLHVMDNDTNEDWKIEDSNVLNRGKFDAIVHFGLLYHLFNWRKELENCFKHSDLLCLETSVTDTNSDTFEFIRGEMVDGFDQGTHDKSAIPSATGLERFVVENLEVSYIRFDDAEISAGVNYGHWYHWRPDLLKTNTEVEAPYSTGKRRFYIMSKSPRVIRELAITLPPTWHGTIYVQDLNPADVTPK